MATVQANKTEPTKSVKPEEMIVRSRFIKTPPDKLRLVCRIALGKEVGEAITAVSFLPQTARHALLSVLKASISQANDKNITEPLFVKAIAVDEGPKLKRRRIVHQGRATNILKRMSHITIYLSVKKPVKYSRKGSK